MSTEDGSELKKELNSLWRSTLDQLDEIKDSIVRSGDAGKAKLDATFLARQRDKLMMDLGRVIYEEYKGVPEGEIPGHLQSKIERITELEEQIDKHESEVDRFLGREREDETEAPADDKRPS